MERPSDVLQYRFFKGQGEAPHLACDLGYWRRYYQRKGNAIFNHGKSLQKTATAVDNRIKDIDSKNGKGEKLLMSELKHLKAMDDKQAQQFFDDAKEYFASAIMLESFEDSPTLKVKRLEREYQKTFEKFEESLELVTARKETYYKVMASLEKVEIKKMLAIKSKKVTQYLKKYEELKKKSKKYVTKYTKALEKSKDCLERADKSAQRYQIAYGLREISRGKHVMSNIHDSIELSHSWKHGTKHSQFDEVDIEEIVSYKISQHMETVNAPAFQPYVYTGNKNELWDQMRIELNQEESGSHLDVGSHVDLGSQVDLGSVVDLGSQIDPTPVVDLRRDGGKKIDNADKGDVGGNDKYKHKDKENDKEKYKDKDTDKDKDKELSKEEKKQAKKLRKENAFVVIMAYKKQNKQELSLKKGELVIPVLKANLDGLAYGEVKRGTFGKKKRGFFPVSHVASAPLAVSQSAVEMQY